MFYNAGHRGWLEGNERKNLLPEFSCRSGAILILYNELNREWIFRLRIFAFGRFQALSIVLNCRCKGTEIDLYVDLWKFGKFFMFPDFSNDETKVFGGR